jgi:hypothetical protein
MKKLLLALTATLLALPAHAQSTLYSNSMTGQVSIGTSSPTTGVALDVGSNTNSILLPIGTTGQRPTGVAGMVRYNSTNSIPEFYISGWLPVPLTASSPIVINSTTGNITCPTCNTSSSNVISISGDGALITNSASTGAVTLSLGNAAAYSVWGNNTSSTALPVYTNSPKLSGSITDIQSIGATSTDGVVLTNTTAASSGNQSWSPRVRWTGQGWKTNTTAASQEVDAIAEIQPVQGSASPTFNWVLSGQINGGGYTPLLTIPSGGGLNLTSGVYEINGTQLAASNLLNGVTGSGSIVLATSPTLTTPNIGAATGTSLTLSGTITASNIRTRLSANQTFYLSPTGTDSGNCLTSGTACATLNYVWNLIAENYDLAGFTATIQLADGTYTSGLDAVLPVPTGSVIINGDSTTPSNVVISTSGDDAVAAEGVGVTFTIQNLEMTASGSESDALVALGSAVITMGPGLVFGAVDATSGGQITAQGRSTIYIGASYSIVGGGGFHYYVADGSLIRVVSNSITATVTGTPAFGQEFASSIQTSQIGLAGLSYSGSATGTRYYADLNGVIDTDTGNANYLPGNAAGSTSMGGQYY